MSRNALLIATIVIVSLLLAFITTALFSPKVVSEADKLKQLTEELNNIVTQSNSGIVSTISGATNKKKAAEEAVIRYTKCISDNESNLQFNKSLTVTDFGKGQTVKGIVDCESIKINSGTATGAINPVPSGPLAPNQLYLTAKVSDDCIPSQTPEQHYKSNRRLAWDVVCKFGGDKIGQFQLYAPDYNNQVQTYTVSDIYKSQDTGNTIDLTFGNKRWTIGHITTTLKKGDVVKTGQLIGQTDLSGVTTGHHSHVELWIEGRNVAYDNYSKQLDTFRKTPSPKVPYGWGSTYYFTAYNLGDVNQNDAAPCIGASGKNLCDLEANGVRTIALTADVRNSLGIKFGDKIRLEGPCSGIYQVEDEMNCRFRGKPCWYMKNGKRVRHPTGHVLRPGTDTYIKGDIPSCGGGAHKILPL